MRVTITGVVLALSAFQATITASPFLPPQVPGPTRPTASPSTTHLVHAPKEVFLSARHDSVQKFSRRQFCGKLAEVCDLFCVVLVFRSLLTQSSRITDQDFMSTVDYIGWGADM
jgi:hypothetical protein